MKNKKCIIDKSIMLSMFRSIINVKEYFKKVSCTEYHAFLWNILKRKNIYDSQNLIITKNV